jgi:hypothetical protein
MSVILISYTGNKAAGGVPRWLNDFSSGINNVVSYSWFNVDEQWETFKWSKNHFNEWDRARDLNEYLLSKNLIRDEDIVIVDGFWGLGLEVHKNVVSVAHGIWSHLIKEEADAGVEGDFPLHHEQQVKFRREHLERDKKIVAVSEFIAHQMNVQWGFNSTVINNAIDINKFKPVVSKQPFNRFLIIHGVNDKTNNNKGWDHISYCAERLQKQCLFLSLDEAHSYVNSMGFKYSKYEVLSLANMVLIPSAYEGNSYNKKRSSILSRD